MITKKQINEHFLNYPKSNGSETFIQLYSKTEKGTYVQQKYMGYISLNKGKATHMFSNKTTGKIDELIQIASDWANSTPFTSDTYSIDYIEGYSEMLQIAEYLKKLGFKYDHSYGSKLTYKISSLYKSSNFISITVDRNNDYKDENDPKVKIVFNLGDDSWIPIEVKSTEEGISAINSILAPVCIEISTNVNKMFLYMKDNNIDNSKYQEYSIKTMDFNTLSVHEVSLKDKMIEILEAQLEQLKAM